MTATIGYGVSCYRRSLAAALRDRYGDLGFIIEDPSLEQIASPQGGIITATVFPMRAKPEHYPSDAPLIGVECCIDVSIPYQQIEGADIPDWDRFTDVCADILHWLDQDLNRWWARGMAEPYQMERRHLWRAHWADLVDPTLLDDCTEPPPDNIGTIEQFIVNTPFPPGGIYTWTDGPPEATP